MLGLPPSSSLAGDSPVTFQARIGLLEKAASDRTALEDRLVRVIPCVPRSPL
jgi:hypothetical protein